MNAEIYSFATKLTSKTDEGKVPWKETADEDSFICSLDNEVVFEIKFDDTDDSYFLGMRDVDDTSILGGWSFKPSGNTTSVDDKLYEVLKTLYEKARRSALKLDVKIKKATKLLDEL